MSSESTTEPDVPAVEPVVTQDTPSETSADSASPQQQGGRQGGHPKQKRGNNQPPRGTGTPMHLSDLKNLHVTELVEMAQTAEVENANRMRKQDLIFALLKNTAKRGDKRFVKVSQQQ